MMTKLMAIAHLAKGQVSFKKGCIIGLFHISFFDFFLKPNGFKDICEKLLSDPFVLFLVTPAMFFAESNWSCWSMTTTRASDGNSSNGFQPGDELTRRCTTA